MKPLFRVEEELKLQKSRQESIARQKSRELSLAKDGNTQFFHANLLNRLRRNKINMVYDGDRWLHDPTKISRYFLKSLMTLLPQIVQLFQRILAN